jgi:hypothetical protein
MEPKVILPTLTLILRWVQSFKGRLPKVFQFSEAFEQHALG